MSYVESNNVGYRPFFARIWESTVIQFEIIGYSRAAAHLAANGLHEQSKYCMMQIKDLRKA